MAQVEGRKEWRVYNPLQQLPRQHSGDLTTDQLAEPVITAVLGPGDMLYFPRGAPTAHTLHFFALSFHRPFTALSLPFHGLSPRFCCLSTVYYCVDVLLCTTAVDDLRISVSPLPSPLRLAVLLSSSGCAGWVHQARATGGSHSVHLTMSTYQGNSWSDVLATAVQYAGDDCVELRRQV